mmetsp:Transcript_8602/g.17529  ORF Transcript_8602/g.17529 Transcript_8602/m.17529 type:complete len:96 (+) Transcript_8602:988-1275(+)
MRRIITSLSSSRICTALALDPKQRFTRCHICDGAVDLDKLRSALKHFEGSHDFRAFAGAIEQNERRTGKEMETIRTVYKGKESKCLIPGGTLICL